MQAASTESVVDGVEPRGTLPVPPRMPSSPSVPSKAPNLLLPPTGVVLLVRTMGADVPLHPFLRRKFEIVVQSEMPCACASSVGASGDGRNLLHTAAYEVLTAGFSSGNSLVEKVQ